MDSSQSTTPSPSWLPKRLSSLWLLVSGQLRDSQGKGIPEFSGQEIQAAADEVWKDCDEQEVRHRLADVWLFLDWLHCHEGPWSSETSFANPWKVQSSILSALSRAWSRQRPGSRDNPQWRQEFRAVVGVIGGRAVFDSIGSLPSDMKREWVMWVEEQKVEQNRRHASLEESEENSAEAA